MIGVANYRWSSVDIGRNTVLKPQTKVDHVGKTLTFLIGEFTGGRFRTVDNTCVLTEPNTMLIYDASKPHLSEPHTGVRLSVTVYYHRLAHSLPLSERTRLNSLGFHMDPIVQVTSNTMGTNQSVDPLSASPGEETNMVPPDTLEAAAEPSILTPPTVLKPVKGGRKAVIKHLPKNVKPLYAGGASRSQKLIESIRQRVKLKGHRRTTTSRSRQTALCTIGRD